MVCVLDSTVQSLLLMNCSILKGHSSQIIKVVYETHTWTVRRGCQLSTNISILNFVPQVIHEFQYFIFYTSLNLLYVYSMQLSPFFDCHIWGPMIKITSLRPVHRPVLIFILIFPVIRPLVCFQQILALVVPFYIALSNF